MTHDDENCQDGGYFDDELKRIGNNKKPYRKHKVRAKAKAARAARKANRT